MDVVVVKIEEHLVTGKPLGRHVEHDPRSRDFAVEEAHAVAQLQAVSHIRRGGVFNQGHIGSCTGNAMVGALNTAPLGNPADILAEKDALTIYEAATVIDGISGQYPPTDTGSSGLAVCKVAKSRGLISGYRHAFSVRSALTALQSGPVITGVTWYEGFDTPDEFGLVKIAGQVRGGHEFEVVGYNPQANPVEGGTVYCFNSWGDSWGRHGQFLFTVKTWDALLHQQGDVTVPLA